MKNGNYKNLKIRTEDGVEYKWIEAEVSLGKNSIKVKGGFVTHIFRADKVICIEFDN